MCSLLYYLRILSHLLRLVKHFFSGFFVDFLWKQSIMFLDNIKERGVCFDSFMCICR